MLPPPISHLPSSQADAPLRIGVMGCSSFALRAMVPAMEGLREVHLSAIASRDPLKGKETARRIGCGVSCSYDELVANPDLDAIYMPLPTGIHEEWVHKALDGGKHLLVEKSLAGDIESARRMIDHARSEELLILENFLFPRHSQIRWVKGKIFEGAIGEFKFFRAAFTIPPLEEFNFRYNGQMGGGHSSTWVPTW